MRAFNAVTRLLAVGVPVVLLAGCDLFTDSKDTNTPTDWEASTDLQSEFGGYTMTDEAANFGDAQVRWNADLEGELQPVAEGDSIPSDSTYAVRILWGHLRGDRDATTEIDWTGSVSLSEGRLAVLRTLAFEMPLDHLVRPRISPLSVSFVSHTQPSFDGLLLLAHTRSMSTDNATAATGSITLTTGPYTHTWTLAELVGANLVIPVDDLGNAVSINAIALRRLDCPKGFARGGWVAREGERGVFRGAWLAANGNPLGAMRGHFGINMAGEHVWFAKIIGREGRILGLARGSWAPDTDPMVAGGEFHGRFVTRLPGADGEIHGRFVAGREGENGSTGFFEARWSIPCEN